MSKYVVLLYHGVHGDDLDLGLCNKSGKHVSRRQFTDEMRWLSENRPLVSMHDIDRVYRGEGTIPDGAVAINFDDGFQNNYTDAWPVLKAFKVPATIYLATGYVGTGRMIWTDRLEAAILGSEKQSLGISIEDGPRSWPLETDADRLAAFMEIKALCKTLPNATKETVIGAVEAEMDFRPDPNHPLYAFLNWDQVREMDASPFIDFGAHTVDHVSLSRIPENEMRRQIDQSIARLEAELSKPCTLFSYPEGQAGDYDERVISYLRERGLGHCPSAIDGANSVAGTDPFHIRRTMVGFENRPFPFAA